MILKQYCHWLNQEERTMEKTQLHKPTITDIAVAIVGIAMAIITFIRIPQAFILEALLVMITAVYMLACIGFFDDTDIEE